MMTFKYSGISRDGVKVNGVIRAYNEYEAVTVLRETCPVITRIREVPESVKVPAGGGRISPGDLAIMCSQFAIILSTGMSMARCVSMVARQTKKKDVRLILERVAADIDAGYALGDSFEKEGPKLPATFVETIRAGEASGRLTTCFERLHSYYERMGNTRAKVTGAMTYPAIVMVAAVVVFVLIMVLAVPMFTKAFMNMEMELPGITRALIAMSEFFRNFWWLLLILAGLLAAGAILMKKTVRGQQLLSRFSLLRSPLKSLIAMNCSAQFANTMSTILSSGLGITRALEVTAGTISNFTYSEAVRRVREEVEQGKGIAASMEENSCFDPTLTEMTGVGESAGTLSQTLEVVGKYYTNEVEITATRFLGILEPAMILALAGITILLLLAVYLPMFSMYGNI